ncbi:MAG: aldo/keto reductase [Rhizobium sp.]|nr:aldo/keto reductase [Rhizobium sp.]
MQKRALGRTGLSIAPVVFGGNVLGWTADEATSFALLDRFFEAGFNTIDTADMYSQWADGNVGGESETIIGNWLNRGGIRREDVVIVTKVGADLGGKRRGLSARRIAEAVEDSLKRLRTDYIDLYLAHWPDAETEDEESLTAFAKLKEAGKVRAIGCSNLDAEQLQATFDAAKKAGVGRYDVIQPEYNLYTRSKFEGDLATLCQREEIGVISYYALASGFLTGKYRLASDTVGKARGEDMGDYLNPRGLQILDALDAIAADTKTSPATVAIAWIAAQPGITAPIASATSLRQLDSLIAAGQLTLTETQITQLNEASA